MRNEIAKQVDKEHARGLLKLISNRYNGFNVCQLNARSLNAEKIDYLNFVFDNLSIDLICITETWFKDYIDNNVYSLCDYTIIRCDRTTKTRGGGIALYFKNNFKWKEICRSDHFQEVEFIFVEFYDNNTKCLVACIYNPSNRNDLSVIFDKLAEFHISYEHIIVCGDLNVDLLCDNFSSRSLIDSFQSLGISLINEYATRFAPHCKPSLLDVFCVSDRDYVSHIDQLPMAGVSDHELIFLSYNIQFNRHNQVKEICFRDFKLIQHDLLNKEAAELNWNMCRLFTTVDEKLQHFNALVSHLFDRFVPLRKVKVHGNRKPWFTREILSLIRERSKAYKKWKNDRNTHSWQKYRVARNKVTAITRDAKRAYLQWKLNDSLPPKVLWKNLKTLGVSGENKSVCSLDPEILNTHFLASNRAPLDIPVKVPLREHVDDGEFEFVSATEMDLIQCVHTVKSNAMGTDGICLKFLKIILPFVIPSLTHIINFSITSSTFPYLWKIANIIPVPKIKCSTAPQHFRPISILPALSKVFEKFLARQITCYLDKNNLLSNFQSGFRSLHSCSTAMLKIFEDVRSAYDKNYLTVLVLLDFSKAFDTIDHNILLQKLCYHYKFGAFSLQLIKSYLSNRLQQVKCGDNYSSLKPITSGVPQGSILGPILFCIFINDIVECCQNSSIHLYADDTQIYLSRPIGLIEDLIARLNEDLTRISNWSKSNNLKLNESKTKAIAISHSKYDLNSLPPILLNEVNINFDDIVTNLGYRINSRLSCVDHVNFVVNKVYNILRKLYCTAYLLPRQTKLKLVRSLIVPHVSYAELVYCRLDNNSKQKLQIALNNAARFVFEKKKYDHISIYSKQILHHNLDSYLKIRSVLFLHKLIYTQKPLYLYKNIKQCQCTRTLNLIVPTYTYLESERMFFVSAIKLWNSIPTTIKLIKQARCFKTAVSNYF